MVTISQFRKEVFTFVENAAKGEVVEFVHKGIRFRLVPDLPRVDKLSRITPFETNIAVGTPEEFADAHRKMTEEIHENWEKQWDPVK